MGPIAEKLSYLADTKDLFKDRLNSLGAEITSSTTFRNYLNWLDTFYGEVSDKTDLSVNGVVGRTSQDSTTGKNLLNSIGLTTQTIDGVTFTPVYENNLLQYIQANGTATNGINYYIQNDYTLNETGTFYITDGIGEIGGENNNTFFTYCGLGASGRTDLNNGRFTVSDASVKSNIRIVVRSGVTLNNIKFYPMISKVINDTYEPYTNGASPNPDFPQTINNLSGDVAYKVSGKNLFNENYYSDKTKYEKNGNYYAFAELPDTFKTKFYANVFLKGISNNLTICFNDSKSIPSKDKKVLDGGVINSNVEFDFTNSEKVYIGIGNGSGIYVDTDINNIFNNYNIMVSTTSGEQYEPYIEPQTFNIPLKSKNLFDKDSITNGKYIKADGTTGTDATAFFSNYIKIEPNTNYYISGRTIWNSIGLYDSNKTFLERINLNYTSGIINITNNNCAYIIVNASIDNLNSMQLEKGNQATTYEPYYDIELGKITTYEDKIYSSNGRFYLNKNIGKVVLNGSETGWENTYGTNLFDINSFLNSKPFIVGYGLCNYYRYNSVQSGINNTLSNGEFALQKYTKNNPDEYSVFIKNTSINNVNDFKQWLSTHNTIIYYPLATPTTTEITQENYPSLYNALKQIQDYLTAYKINKEFILGYSSPEIEY